MRNLSRISLVMAASAALVGTIALPASAADDTTATTVNVAAGALGITAPATALLPEVAPGATTNVALGDVVVQDLRAGIAVWATTVVLTDFTGPSPILASAASYTPGTAVVTGNATVAESASRDLSAITAVQTASDVSGNNTATWGADLALTAPAQALAGEYTAELTHSVL